jgi:hypothetical protein
MVPLQGQGQRIGVRRDVRPNRIRHPTDCMFASGCSSPRLTATQFPWATGIEHLPGRVAAVETGFSHSRPLPDWFLCQIRRAGRCPARRFEESGSPDLTRGHRSRPKSSPPQISCSFHGVWPSGHDRSFSKYSRTRPHSVPCPCPSSAFGSRSCHGSALAGSAAVAFHRSLCYKKTLCATRPH